MNTPPTVPIVDTQKVEFRMKSQQAMVDTFAWQCCLNCEHWAEQNLVKIEDKTKYSGFVEVDQGPLCRKYMQRPPTKFIIIGCPEYTDCIPF